MSKTFTTDGCRSMNMITNKNEVSMNETNYARRKKWFLCMEYMTCQKLENVTEK